MNLHFSVLKKLFETINASFFRISSEIGLTVGQHEFGMEVKLNRFSHLREVHLSLCEIAEDLNQFYSHSLLLSVAYVFYSLVLYAYYMTNVIMQSKEKSISPEQARYYLTQLGHYGVPVVCLAWAASNVIDEV